MSKRSHPDPAGGRWAWREYLPTTIDEWLALRERAAVHAPTGLDLSLFSDWMLAEMRGEAAPVRSNGTLPKYRRLLFELAEAPTPPSKRRTREAGRASLRSVGGTLAASAAAGGALALTGSPIVALGVFAPVILERPVMSSAA